MPIPSVALVGNNGFEPSKPWFWVKYVCQFRQSPKYRHHWITIPLTTAHPWILATFAKWLVGHSWIRTTITWHFYMPYDHKVNVTRFLLLVTFTVHAPIYAVDVSDLNAPSCHYIKLHKSMYDMYPFLVGRESRTRTYIRAGMSRLSRQLLYLAIRLFLTLGTTPNLNDLHEFLR